MITRRLEQQERHDVIEDLECPRAAPATDVNVRGAVEAHPCREIEEGQYVFHGRIVDLNSRPRGDVNSLGNRIQEGCPVTQYIRSTGKLADAYVHPGDFGVEPTTTIIARHPQRLLEIMAEIVAIE